MICIVLLPRPFMPNAVLLMVVLLIASHPRQTPSSTPCGRNFTPVVGAPHGLLIPMGEMDASRPSGICCDGANVRRQKEPAGVGAGREFKSDEGSCWWTPRISTAHFFDVIEIAAVRGRM